MGGTKTTKTERFKYYKDKKGVYKGLSIAESKKRQETGNSWFPTF